MKVPFIQKHKEFYINVLSVDKKNYLPQGGVIQAPSNNISYLFSQVIPEKSSQIVLYVYRSRFIFKCILCIAINGEQGKRHGHIKA